MAPIHVTRWLKAGAVYNHTFCDAFVTVLNPFLLTRITLSYITSLLASSVVDVCGAGWREGERMNRNVLVTGAFGNIGSFVIGELQRQGFQVIAFDKETPVNRSNARKFADPGILIHWGDIRDKEEITRALEGVHAMIYLAGVLPPFSEKNPQLTRASM